VSLDTFAAFVRAAATNPCLACGPALVLRVTPALDSTALQHRADAADPESDLAPAPPRLLTLRPTRLG